MREDLEILSGARLKAALDAEAEAMKKTEAWWYVVKLLAGSTALGWVLVKIGEGVLGV